MGDYEKVKWYVLSDTKPQHARMPGYRYLQQRGIEVFTPMTEKIVRRRGKTEVVEVPAVQNLLFVHSSRELLDPHLELVSTLNYRFVKGKWNVHMAVPEQEMLRFIKAVQGGAHPRYFKADEIGPQHVGRKVRIVGGALDGCEGTLLTVRGSKYKRLFVQIPDLLAVSVEIEAGAEVILAEED